MALPPHLVNAPRAEQRRFLGMKEFYTDDSSSDDSSDDEEEEERKVPPPQQVPAENDDEYEEEEEEEASGVVLSHQPEEAAPAAPAAAAAAAAAASLVPPPLHKIPLADLTPAEQAEHLALPMQRYYRAPPSTADNDFPNGTVFRQAKKYDQGFCEVFWKLCSGALDFSRRELFTPWDLKRVDGKVDHELSKPLWKEVKHRKQMVTLQRMDTQKRVPARLEMDSTETCVACCHGTQGRVRPYTVFLYPIPLSRAAAIRTDEGGWGHTTSHGKATYTKKVCESMQHNTDTTQFMNGILSALIPMSQFKDQFGKKKTPAAPAAAPVAGVKRKASSTPVCLKMEELTRTFLSTKLDPLARANPESQGGPRAFFVSWRNSLMDVYNGEDPIDALKKRVVQHNKHGLIRNRADGEPYMKVDQIGETMVWLSVRLWAAQSVRGNEILDEFQAVYEQEVQEQLTQRVRHADESI